MFDDSENDAEALAVWISEQYHACASRRRRLAIMRYVDSIMLLAFALVSAAIVWSLV